MPFQATRRHQYWTVDMRYLDMHQLGGGMIYCISILENYSRCILASMLSRSQDLTAYLMVLYAAIRRYGSPEALVSDGGAIFRATRATAVMRLAKSGRYKRSASRYQCATGPRRMSHGVRPRSTHGLALRQQAHAR